MQKQFKRRWFPELGCLLIVSLSYSLAGGQSAPGNEQRDTAEFDGRTVARAAPSKPPIYWLGVQCRPVDESLRAHLDIPDAQGLLVGDVAPASPAAAAGIERYDVILSADSARLRIPGDLVEAVESAAGESISLELLRKGELLTTAVKPARRPEEAGGRNPSAVPGSEAEALRKWTEELQGAAGQSKRFRFIHPGMILPPDAPCHPPLPADMSLTIVKRGGDPIRITIVRKGKKWEVTENELDTLPDDVRPYAEQMLGRTMTGPVDPVRLFDFFPEHARQSRAGASSAVVPDDEVEQCLDEMTRQVEQLHRAMEQMRNRTPLSPAPAEE
ncbi:MAG: PDZ domain-containing protein [Rhodopirellula sp.]|nr:PDZ domain-containing protein [Rhodopirellula sp.]